MKTKTALIVIYIGNSLSERENVEGREREEREGSIKKIPNHIWNEKGKEANWRDL